MEDIFLTTCSPSIALKILVDNDLMAFILEAMRHSNVQGMKGRSTLGLHFNYKDALNHEMNAFTCLIDPTPEEDPYEYQLKCKCECCAGRQDTRDYYKGFMNG
jgi:hypothetical protein